MALFVCPHCDDVIELLGDRRDQPQCECGAIMEPLDLAEAARVADFILWLVAPAGS